MKAKELKAKYLKYFENKGHQIIPSASLVPSEEVELAGTQKVLFTTAGMHPLIPYLLGKKHPLGKRLVNFQKCLRTDDIGDIGDLWHNTFFEMLGNWSLGDPASPDGIGKNGYWKEEAISWSFDFLLNELKLDAKRIYVSVFAGDDNAPFDRESYDIWKKLGVGDDHIFKYGKNDNWWGPVGPTGPCGPDTEMFYDTNLPKHGPGCSPGDNCGKYVEVWNDVFMEFNKTADGKYEPSKQKNVDTGMGLERTSAVLEGKTSVYETELFLPIIAMIQNSAKLWHERSARIVADHIKAAVFLISDQVLPTNTDRGYIVRRLVRRAIRYGRQLGLEDNFFTTISKIIINLYKIDYPELNQNQKFIISILNLEAEKFEKAISSGLKKTARIFNKKTAIPADKFAELMGFADKKDVFRDLFAAKKVHKKTNDLLKELAVTEKEIDLATISGQETFDLYQTYGFPIEIVVELAQEKHLVVDVEAFKEQLNKHQQLSRSSAIGKFKGGMAGHDQKTIAGHTATHLLHQALRDVLGNEVHQTGSHITSDRIRFDFAYDKKSSNEQVKRIESIVNQKIKANLKVLREYMSQDKADKLGAIGLFKEKYKDKVSIYKIGNYSIEYCGGPHVNSTAALQGFKIKKEESIGSGRRRIYAELA